ncbi:unnamed protein product, partial [Oppiella nova]
NIIILVGDKGVFLSAFVRDKIIDKFSECKIRHDLIPILQSIVKTNPIEKFIDEYFAKDDIVAHYVYNITRDTSEVWNTLFVSTPYKPPLSTLLEYTFEYPHDKSNSYIQGIIEQEFKPTNSRLHLDEINWQRLNLDNFNNLSIETAKKLLQEHIAQLHSIFNTMDINFIIFEDQIIDLPDKIIIPISIILTDQKGQNAQESLTEETLKLYSIINSKNKILKTYKEYTKLLNIPPIQNCLKRIKIINSISTISNKYNLAEPIDTTMTQSFLNTNKKKDTIEIKNYDVNLKFAAPNFPTLLAIIKDAYSYMPKNSVVISIQIQQQTLLEPKIIYKLSTERYPDLIYTKLNMRIREITITLANIIAIDYVTRLNSKPVLKDYITESIRKLKIFLGQRVITDDSFSIVLMLFAIAISPEDVEYKDKDNILNKEQLQDKNLNHKTNLFKQASSKILTAFCALAVGAISVITAGAIFSVIIVPASILTIKYAPKLGEQIGKIILNYDHDITSEIERTNIIQNSLLEKNDKFLIQQQLIEQKTLQKIEADNKATIIANMKIKKLDTTQSQIK